MSAIAGIVSLDGRPIDPQRMSRIAQATTHVKTDRIGRWHSDHAGLLHFQWVTTAEALHEVQPLADAPSGLVAILDGRLDNRAELLRFLSVANADHANFSDCRIVLDLYQREGEACLQRLVGDYAFALWQPRERRLFCARSPLGWRPLLWYSDASVFAFATEPKSLIDGVGIPRQVNEGAMGEYLAMRFATQTDTLWRGIHRLPPGSALSVEAGRVRQWHWHQGPFPESLLSEDETVEQFRALFDRALMACSRSHTEVAAHLSGGLDSSSIVCRATELHRAGRLAGLLHPVSARFPGESHDESEWSAAVERHTGIAATVISPRDYSWEQAHRWCADSLQLPLRPNVLSTIIGSCEHLEAAGIRVLLTGEGGDDWLRGSRAHWPDLLRRGHLTQLWREAISHGHGRYIGRLKRLLYNSAGPLLLARHREQMARPHLEFSHVPPEWLRPEWAARNDLSERWRADRSPYQLDSFAQRGRCFRYVMARSHINHENVLSFAASKGVELRHPLHDLRLTHFLMGVPGAMLLRRGEHKYLLRQAMRGTLPERVRTRQSKAQFVPPMYIALDQFFAATPVKQLLAVQMGWVDSARIEAYRHAHLAWFNNGRPGQMPLEPLGPLWALISTEIWLRHAHNV